MRTPRWKLIMVVVSDPFAREQRAVAKAAAVASRCKAHVVLFNAFMISQPVSDLRRAQMVESVTREREEQLSRIAAKARLPSTTKCIVRWDYPADEAVVRQVRRTKPDLLMMESHRHGRVARMVLVNTDWLLIRDCPCPLWFVRSPDLPRQSRWLVAVDPRHTHAKPARLDDRLLRAAQNAVGQLGGRVSVVHAYEIPPAVVAGMLTNSVRPPISSRRTREYVAATVESVVKLASRHGVARTNCMVRAGEASYVVASEANHLHADVLVMGAVSRSLLARPVIGATAERVIDQVDCDIFVVKPAGFKAKVRRPMAQARLPRMRKAPLPRPVLPH